jgi:hypothetical protein
MKKLVAVALLAALPLGAQEKSAQKNGTAVPSNGAIRYTPVSCARGGEMPLMQMAVQGKGELRAYFRRINTTDWCSVEGVNDGPLSRVVLPKFDPGDEIEYFFVLIDGRRVVSRTPRIYRMKVTNECEAAFARHLERFSVNCGEEPGGIPTSIGAGFALTDDAPPPPTADPRSDPPQASPDRPPGN